MRLIEFFKILFLVLKTPFPQEISCEEIKVTVTDMPIAELKKIMKESFENIGQ